MSSNSECSALLHFNHSLSLNESASPPFCENAYTINIQMCENSYPKTGSWKEDKDCCTWDGVVCDNSTRHVIALDLSCSWLYGSIPSNSTLFLLRHLRSLNLAGNDFDLSLISPEFGKFQSLTHLNLSNSLFSGEIPYEISQLSSLVSLDLSYNGNLGSYKRSQLRSLSIETPVWKRVIGNLTQLRELFLHDADMHSITPNSLMNLSSSLTTLSLPEWAIPTSIGNLTQIIKLDLSDNDFSGLLPSSIFDLPNLSILGLYNNQLIGSLPNHLGAVGGNSLCFLDLSNNFLTSIDKIPWKNLNLVDLHNNLLQGPFPTLNALNLRYLFASNNNLSGGIPSLICNASSLEILDLSHNNFSGTIPKCLVLCTVLSVLDLRMNSLNGSIPATFSCGNYLRNIDLNGNQLEGPLPRSLENCTNLEVLDLGNNKINDTFPYWLESILELQVLVIRSNKFQGHIGNLKAEFPFPNLRILDISNNEFNGPLPIKYFKYLKAMMNVDEGKVGLKYMGDEYYHDSLNVTIKWLNIELVRIQTVFTIIDFSNNSFIGEIPQIIGSLNSLKGLNFSHNNLIGYIPSSFGHLTNLEWLDLSFNKLDGEIPKQLEDLNQLAVLELSHNQLTGPIPSGKQFNTFENNSYANNLGLCGFPLTRTCNNHKSKQPPPSTWQQENNLEPKYGFGWQAVLIGYGCGVIFGTFMGYLMFKIGKPKWIVRMVKLEQHILLRRLKNNARRSGGRK
ncbi:hypothetical protein CMV_003956 [Castanea mollissima]|uniref:Leucine-rich repeat-containing N-terminal plant-type domain-containing protein n=1 Tax=Castanea mollissima TaxID=60419 RepID=A0A8J4RSD7_9ROSI|nr:hypothetical protein CMV_003956 [Castanea mollissima]